jgi:hypothetical protein
VSFAVSADPDRQALVAILKDKQAREALLQVLEGMKKIKV